MWTKSISREQIYVLSVSTLSKDAEAPNQVVKFSDQPETQWQNIKPLLLYGQTQT